MTPICSFSGTYLFLSNFYPCTVVFEGAAYPSSEHAYQAAKTHDARVRRTIQALATPGLAKRAGRRVVLREDWEDVKLSVMWAILVDKFTRNPALGYALWKTAPAILVEGNTWGDTFWGVCRGVGDNHLGKQLMFLRAQLHFSS